METKKLTAAESTLAAMSKTVLVLGIIGSVFAFFSSCIAWEYSKYSGGIVGVDGINWLGFPVLIGNFNRMGRSLHPRRDLRQHPDTTDSI